MYDWNKAAGFTLIEMVVSIAILASVTSALLIVFPRNVLLSQSAQNLTRATYLAQAGLEQALNTAFYSLSTGTVEPKARLSQDSASWLYNFQRQIDVAYVDDNLQTSVNDTELKKITATVFWYNPRQSAEQNYTLTTLYTSNKTHELNIYLSYPGATHTGKDCFDANGLPYDSGGGIFCKFNAPDCPAEWSQADDWQRYTSTSWGSYVSGTDSCGWNATDFGPTAFSNMQGRDYGDLTPVLETFCQNQGYTCSNLTMGYWHDYDSSLAACDNTAGWQRRARITNAINPAANRVEIGCK